MSFKKVVLVLILSLVCTKAAFAGVKNPFSKPNDTRSKELKYQYGVLKEDEKNKMEGKLLNRTPSGYMTVDEYESLSEYKDKSTLEFDIPKIDKPSDFKYIPQLLYQIVKYNDPPGGVELSLGKRLFIKRQINAQGIVSPDYSKLVYPAIYYYPDSASVAADLFVIPLDDTNDTYLNKILKANVAKRIPSPILSTDKAIDNFAAFRTLTPVDFSTDGTKLLVKEKIGSSEDGIWQTRVYIYDFKRKTSYDLVEIRDSIVYFWKEYMDVNLDDKRWDIYPLGFDKNSPNRIIVQAYAYTGEMPVYLGAWSIDCYGNQSRLISFNRRYIPQVSINGFKIVKNGVESYQTVEMQEKFLKKQSKVLEKQKKEEDKVRVKEIKDEYKYAVKALDADYKDEYRDYKKLQSLKGSTENIDLENAYRQYLQDQLQKDIQKSEKKIQKKQKEIEKIENKIEKLYNQTGNFPNSSEPETSESIENNPADSVQNQ